MLSHPTNTHPALEEIFRCDDQSALIHNFVANVNPTPGAWSHHAMPQSVLGQVSFPLVLSLTRGEVYTRLAPGQIIEQMLVRQQWLPWAYDGENDALRVERSIGQDVWHAAIRLKEPQPALLLLECASGSEISGRVDVSCTPDAQGMTFRWRDFTIALRFTGDIACLNTSDDPAPLRRRFAGFPDVPLNPAHLNWAWPALHRCWIGVEFTGELDVTFAVRHGQWHGHPAHDVARPSWPCVTGWEARATERQRWEDFFHTQVPVITTDDPVVRDAYYFAWQMLWANRCEGGAGQLPQRFTSPARMFYGAQWWWDEAFNTVMYRHLHDPAITYEFLANFQRAQREDGQIVGYLSFTEDGTGEPPIAMQPPVLGFILQLLRERPGWPADLRPLYEMLLRHARWHDLPHRDTDGDGLVEYHDQNDSAIDQSSRWDAFKVYPERVMGPLHPVEPVDGNVWMSLLWDTLGDMAAQLGDAQAADEHKARGKRMMEQVEALMWDEADGMYYDIDARSHVQNRIKTPFSFMPLLSPHARPERVARLVREHLTNPAEFWCAYPLSSVSLDDPTFDPIDMFRGATWVNINWMVIEGLSRQGYPDLARELARKTVDLVGPRYEHGTRVRSPRLWEWYHPHTGEPLGNCQYTWSGLVVDLILRFLVE